MTTWAEPVAAGTAGGADQDGDDEEEEEEEEGTVVGVAAVHLLPLNDKMFLSSLLPRYCRSSQLTLIGTYQNRTEISGIYFMYN